MAGTSREALLEPFSEPVFQRKFAFGVIEAERAMRRQHRNERARHIPKSIDLGALSFLPTTELAAANRMFQRSSQDPISAYCATAANSRGAPRCPSTAELWIRDSFLRHKGPFPKYIVHGHTPTIYLDPQQTMPDVRDNRCNVDTGAGVNWPLSAAIFNDRQTKPIHTISTGAEN